MNGQENYDSEIDYQNVQFTAPQNEQQKFITSLNNKFQKNKEKQTEQILICKRSKSTSQNNLLKQILTYRFINALRIRSGNVSIDSVRTKHISLLNDMSSNPKYYLYKGSSISRLIKQEQEKTQTNLKISIFGAIINQLPLLQPNSKTSMILDFVCLFVTLFQLIQVPLILSFDVDILILQYAIYFYLTIDSFRAVFTCIYIDGNLVINKKVIFTHYLKSQFFVDIITIYLFWIFQEQYFLRLLFLIRFTKVNDTLNRLELIVNLQNQNLLTLSKSIFLMVFSTHLMCCFQNMIQEATNTKWQSVHPMGDSISLKYLQGLYWAVQTMVSVGYGDVPPITVIQKIYTSFIMFIGICLFSFVMNSIGNVISLLNENRKNHTKFKIEYESYYKSKPLKLEVFQKIRDYNEIAFEFHQTSSNYGEYLLQIVSEELRIEYLEQINGKIIRNNFVFSKFSPQLQRYVIDNLSEQFFLPTDLIATDTNELFILNRGIVKLAKQAMTLEVFSQMNTCLNIINFIINEKEQCQFISINHTLIYRLEKLHLINPSDKELFQYIKDDLVFNKNYRAVGLSCSGCVSPLHVFQDCPEIHFCANKEKILKGRETQFQDRHFFCRNKLYKINTFRYLEKTQVNVLLFIEDALNNSASNLLISFNHTEKKLLTQQLDLPQQKSSQTEKIDTFANLGSNSSNMIQLSSQCVNQLSSAVDPLELEFFIDMETGYEFKTYFPHGNMSNIIKQLNQRIRRPRVRRLQTIFRTGLLKIVAQEELDSMKQKIHKRKHKLEIDRNLISQLQLLGQNSRRSRTFNIQRYETGVNDI